MNFFYKNISRILLNKYIISLVFVFLFKAGILKIGGTNFVANGVKSEDEKLINVSLRRKYWVFL